MSRKRSQNGCMICGHPHMTDACPPGVLRGIDAAHTRAGNAELHPHLYAPQEIRHYATRLSQGFRMLDNDDWGDEE